MKVVYGVFVETFSGVKGAGGAPCFFVSMICCVVMGDASPKSGVIRDEKRNLFLHINQTPIAQWFKEQFGLGQEQRRGIRM